MPFGTADRVPSGADRLKKMQSGLDNMGERWKEGALNPRKHPIKAAIAAKGKWASSVQEAAQKDRFGKGLAQVNEEQMLASINATPSSAVADGVRKRGAKVLAKMEKLAGIQAANAAEIDKLPADTAADRKARMLKNYELSLAVKDKMMS